jgi:hypothetical protein
MATGAHSKLRRKSWRRGRLRLYRNPKKTVPYHGMYHSLGNLPWRVEAIWLEGLRDPAGLRPIRFGVRRDQMDVEAALLLYPRSVVRQLYRGNTP